MSKKTQNWAVPLIAILLGMLVGAVLMLIILGLLRSFLNGLWFFEKYW